MENRYKIMNYKDLEGKKIVNIEMIYTKQKESYNQVKSDEKILFEIDGNLYFIYDKNECNDYYGDETLKITTDDGNIFYIMSSNCCFAGFFKFIKT